MATFRCEVCGYIYDDAREGTPFSELPDSWSCPVCGSPKSTYVEGPADPPVSGPENESDNRERYLRETDEFEETMTDIHAMAATGQRIVEPMRTRSPTFSWNEILIKGAQLFRVPLNEEEEVSLRTTIGIEAAQPLEIESPLFVTHMSFGALSREAKIALAKGAATAGTATCSGEGGILPEALDAAYRYIFEYVPNRYSVTDEYLAKVDAVEIKIGQSAKPGMGGHLPGNKVTPEIAAIRGFPAGEDIVSPAHHADIRTPRELAAKVEELRNRSGDRPIGIKLAAGRIEEDVRIALEAKPDFITIDGRAGATGAAPKYVKLATSIPSMFALVRARRAIDEAGATGVSLVITGGLRTSSDFAKALALGADAIAIGTAALMAIGCQQYRICHTGNCPMGITTHDPDLRARFDVDESAASLSRYLGVVSGELADFARLTGVHSVHDLSPDDLCATSVDMAERLGIEFV